MPGIPPTTGTDSEDVAWALQTAEALWKRSERTDAIVWLRRAAQAAGHAEDDDRALALAREAAELAEWIEHDGGSPAATEETPAASDTDETPIASDVIFDADGGSDDDNAPTIAPPPLDAPRTPPAPPLSPAPPPLAGLPLLGVPAATSLAPPAPTGDDHVRTAAEAHAGMLDPWAESEAPTVQKADAPPQVRSPVPRPRSVPAPRAPSQHRDPPPPPARRPSPTPPPLPATAKTAEEEGVITSAPGPQRTPTPPAPAALAAAAPPSPVAPEPPTPAPAANAAMVEVDLTNIEALGDLPDDAREAFAAAAKVQTLGVDDEVSGFALALVLVGSIDLAATIVDTAAERLRPGAILRSRGTIDHVAPIRLIGASDGARVATWDEESVTKAFRACPWVEDDLRASADRHQALVGVTMGPLGERLDPSLRAIVTDRLKVRTLVAHEVCAAGGMPVPGLLVVGAGELELLGEDGQPEGTVLSPGEFLFAAEALRAAPAPSTARASKGGAIILFADRNLTQELLVTCPPLLEIFAGM